MTNWRDIKAKSDLCKRSIEKASLEQLFEARFFVSVSAQVFKRFPQKMKEVLHSNGVNFQKDSTLRKKSGGALLFFIFCGFEFRFPQKMKASDCSRPDLFAQRVRQSFERRPRGDGRANLAGDIGVDGFFGHANRA